MNLDPDWFRNHKRDITRLRNTFKDYFRRTGRSFPWRKSVDPFQILITECLLQRTRADIVAKIWPDFMTRFGTIEKLTNSSEESLAKAIYPLGLAWRARFLFRLGRELKEEYPGGVPTELRELISLPGVGHYAAAATRSFGHGIREGVVDSNVVRILSRYFDIQIEGDKAPLRFWHPVSRAIANSPHHRIVNYGMLDFASEICISRQPRCHACPLKKFCCFLH